MNNKDLGYSYLKDILHIQQKEETNNFKIIKINDLIKKILTELTKNEVLLFSNFFSKLSFVCNRYNLSTKIHSVRIVSEKIIKENYQISEQEFSSIFKYAANFIASIFSVSIPSEVSCFFPAKDYFKNKISSKQQIKKIRVQVLEIKKDFLICNHEDNTNENYINVRINEDGINEIFESVKYFWEGCQLNLINVAIDTDGVYHPRFIILEPDYLVDISAIAECFQDYGTSEFHFIQNKFEEAPNNKHIRLGNFANSVVDYFCTKKEKHDFNEIFKNDFKNYPLEYTACNDLNNPEEFKLFLKEAENHFKHLKKVLIDNDLPQYNIFLNKALLEPSYLCEQYGIQGRLDFLYTDSNKKNKIIELKSGNTPHPDNGKNIKPNHSAQLYLYYQIIAVLYDLEFKDINKNIEGYILYSKVSNGNLRFDSINLTRIQRILDIRNRIIINENKLANQPEKEIEKLIYAINSNNYIQQKINPHFRDLLEVQINNFTYPIYSSSPLEKAYFYCFTSFITKELYMAKLGIGQQKNDNGLAKLWLNSFQEKIENFEIIYDLEIIENNISNAKREIKLKRTNNDFTSIREGDICILYPRNKATDTVLTNQIFKCTIKSISKEYIVLHFRYQQPSTYFFDSFEKSGKWALERDFMDVSFTSMYRSLYNFIKAPKNKKELILTQIQPKSSNDYNYYNEKLSDEQNRILKKALSSSDYFLLNGPPGTGKTSIIIKELVKEIYENQTSNILLLAYTNRAVDELCEAIDNALSNKIEQKFIRIGNELSTSTKFHENLLNRIIEQKDYELTNNKQKFSRKTIKDIIQNQRIFVSTVASISNKNYILQLKKFDTIIIDEASQILEPHIVGILTKANRFIMIGDHKQLPAIVLQNPISTKTNNKELEKIGLSNRKNSIFERLYEFCEKNNIYNAHDQLTYQGRMHSEIVEFPNKHFYNNKLKVAFDIPNFTKEVKQNLSRQRADLYFEYFDKTNPIHKHIANNRISFTNIEQKSANFQEADLIVNFVKEIIKLYLLNNKKFDAKTTIGIITPFRKQIAIIKQKLELEKIHDHEDITVDTIERYQGSQRDIILYSFAVTNVSQINALVNMNDQGTVDRKLNVALTRAKEQLFLVGNKSILNENSIFKKLIDYLENKTIHKLTI